MIHDVLFYPPQSPVFALFKDLFLHSQSPGFVLVKVPFSSSSKSLFRPPQSPGFVLVRVPFSVLSNSRFLPLKVPFLSSPSPFPILSVLFPPLKVLSPSSSSSQSPLPSSYSKPKKTAERHEAVPPFGVWLVPKWNISGSEGQPNNPLNNVEYSFHSTT